MNSFFCFLGFIIVSAFSLAAQTLPPGFTLRKIADPIKGPTTMTVSPDGRIFICRQSGEIKVVKKDLLLATPALKITVDSTNERGLIGIVLDPDFVNNQYVYLYHTLTTATRRNRISRYTFSGDIINPASQLTILDLDPVTKTNHNGGPMTFGKDGKLYVGVGNNNDDGGDSTFVNPNAQNLDTYKGKLLRINADGSAPADNPFPAGSEQKKRVWAYGVRNPYAVEVHKVTGKIFLNDVGNKRFEEVNDVTVGGKNFGWPFKEGYSKNTQYTNPYFAYQNVSIAGTEGDGIGCAITGGVFFNPAVTNYPVIYQNKYFYLDWCNGWINYIDHTLANPVANAFAANMPVTPATPYKYINSAKNVVLRTGADGSLYFLNGSNYGGTVVGALYKIEYTITSGLREDNASLGVLNVYPVPAKDLLNVKWSSLYSGEGRLVLTNVIGTEVISSYLNISVGENFNSLMLSNLNSGIYFLELRLKGSTYDKQKIVIGE